MLSLKISIKGFLFCDIINYIEMKGFLMIKQIKKPLNLRKIPEFTKDFYCQYKPNFIKNRLLLFHERILKKETKKK